MVGNVLRRAWPHRCHGARGIGCWEVELIHRDDEMRMKERKIQKAECLNEGRFCNEDDSKGEQNRFKAEKVQRLRSGQEYMISKLKIPSLDPAMAQPWALAS